jgi:hypothetical protein
LEAAITNQVKLFHDIAENVLIQCCQINKTMLQEALVPKTLLMRNAFASQNTRGKTTPHTILPLPSAYSDGNLITSNFLFQ